MNQRINEPQGRLDASLCGGRRVIPSGGSRSPPPLGLLRPGVPSAAAWHRGFCPRLALLRLFGRCAACSVHCRKKQNHVPLYSRLRLARLMYNLPSRIPRNFRSSLSHHLHHRSPPPRVRLLLQPPQVLSQIPVGRQQSE